MNFPIESFIDALNTASKQKNRPYHWDLYAEEENSYDLGFYEQTPEQTTYKQFQLVLDKKGFSELDTSGYEGENEVLEDCVSAFSALNWEGLLLTRWATNRVIEGEVRTITPLSEKAKTAMDWIPSTAQFILEPGEEEGELELFLHFPNDLEPYWILFGTDLPQIRLLQEGFQAVDLYSKDEATAYFSMIQKKDQFCEFMHQQVLSLANQYDPKAFYHGNSIFIFRQEIVSDFAYEGAYGNVFWNSNFPFDESKKYQLETVSQTGSEEEFQSKILAAFEKKIKKVRLNSIFHHGNGGNDGLFRAGVLAYGSARNYEAHYKGTVPLSKIKDYLNHFFDEGKEMNKLEPVYENIDRLQRHYFSKETHFPHHTDVFEAGDYYLTVSHFSGSAVISGETPESYRQITGTSQMNDQ